MACAWPGNGTRVRCMRAAIGAGTSKCEQTRVLRAQRSATRNQAPPSGRIDRCRRRISRLGASSGLDRGEVSPLRSRRAHAARLASACVIPDGNGQNHLKRTRHHEAGIGNRARSSIWHATNGCRRLPSPIRFTVRIKVEHYSCNFSPVRTLCVRVEQAQIGDDVFLVVNGQNGATTRRRGNFAGGFPILSFSSLARTYPQIPHRS